MGQALTPGGRPASGKTRGRAPGIYVFIDPTQREGTDALEQLHAGRSDAVAAGPKDGPPAVSKP
jgi:hypothetical protein